MTMTSLEFVGACARLGLSRDDVAAEFDMTPAIIAAWERGTVRVPANVARTLRWRAALVEQQELLVTSGLSDCEEAARLDRAAASEEGEARVAAWTAWAKHGEGCPTCGARRSYLELHGPVMPEFPMPRIVRMIAWGEALVNRVPPRFRLPPGPSAYGRRMALWCAACFSALAIGIAALATISAAARGGLGNWWADVVEPISVVIPGYFIGFFLAGTAYDALRPIGHTFLGYVLRWSLGGGAVYGTIALLMPLIEKKSLSWPDTIAFVGLLAGVWAFIGAGLWIRDRMTGRLPKQAT